jgi:methionyl-tRNA formyltransferase
MLPPAVLGTARLAALNMHGSLLPRYRGRAPVNWAILNGERETGATLHYMVEKPDAGPIVAQESVPIGIDDTALDVSLRLAEAAERLVVRVLPALAAGPPPGTEMDLAQGSYYGGRRPEDGRIDWSWPARRVHDLIRAVAPPFPGAFTDAGPRRIVFGGSHWSGERAAHPAEAPCLYADGDAVLRLDCADGLRLDVPWLTVDGARADAAAFRRLNGAAPLRLGAAH